MQAKSIYIHLPFCKTKCPYCDFASFVEDKEKRFQEYFKALFNEIDYRCQNFSTKPSIETIFFGGGTPSLHEAEEFVEIFLRLKKYFEFTQDIEITLEANPGTVSQAKLEGYLQQGINRLSLGVQTFSEKLIKYLARGHSVTEAKEIISLVKNIGFKSWSIDLIYGLPQQTRQDWLETIQVALSFEPPHVSSYALSIEANTPFGSIYKDSSHPDLPLEDDVVEMYYELNSRLENSGLERYEISNWAKPGHEAAHNLTYWQAQEYFAFGLSAHGYINSKRYANTRDMQAYLDKFSKHNMPQSKAEYLIDADEITESLDKEKMLEERIFLALRLKKGLELTDAILEKIDSKKLEEYIAKAYLHEEKNRLKLDEKALMISNQIIFELIK